MKKRKQINITIYLALFFSLLGVYANETNFRYDNLNFKEIILEDLPSPYVKDIIQDKEGFIWLATQNGLCRYDAYGITTYQHRPGDTTTISGNYITSLWVDKKGDVWVGTSQNGVNRLEKQTGWFYRFLSSPHDSSSLYLNRIKDIHEDRQGDIWVATGDGLGRIDQVTHTIKKIDLSKSGNNVSGIGQPKDVYEKVPMIDIETDGNNIWMGTYGHGLMVYNTVSKAAEQYILGKTKEENIVNLIKKGPYGFLHILTQKGVHLLFDTKEKRVFNTLTVAMDNHKFSISSINNESIWVGMENRLYICAGPNFNEKIEYTPEVKTGHVISGKNIKVIFQDNQKNIWLAEDSKRINVGFLYFNDFEKYHHSVPRKKPKANGKVLFIDKNNNLWYGTFGHGLLLFDENNTLLSHFLSDGNSNTLAGNDVWCIGEDKKGYIWIGTDNGISVYDTKSQKFIKTIRKEEGLENQITHNLIYDILHDGRGNTWIATQEGLDLLLQDGTIKHYSEKDGLSHYKPKVLMKDGKDNIWIGTFNGLSRYDPEEKTFTNFYHDAKIIDQTLSNNQILSLLSDQEGNIWVGTQNGLNVLDLETGLVKKKFFKTDGLNSNRINALEKDKKDGVWILTSEGLSRINTQKGIISAYSKENNLYTHNTGLLTHEDEVLVSAELSGFYKFKATDIKTNPVPPPVHIISIKINGIPLDDAKLNNEMLKLNHNESSIEFEFTALNYLSPEKNRYKYKLEGFDNAWKTTGADKRFATYTNLSPGDYAFRVLGSNNNGVWNQTGDTFEFTILPPWWRAPWAITMFLILFVSTLFLLWLIRKKMSLMKQKNEKAILQHEMDENQLHFFTNISHEIRTPLSLISTPIENILETTELNEDVKTKLLLVKNNTVKLQSLIDQLLDFRKLKVGAYRMKPENLDIVKYVNHVFQIFKPLFTKNHIYFTYYCQTKSRIIFVDPEVLDRILNNLLSNALKNTPHDGNVKMELHVFPESYMINVCNTGKGLEQKEFNKIFTRFYQGENKNNIKQGGFGIGLSVAKQYVDYLNGKIEVNETSNNETRFSILLPITEPVEETVAHFPVEERPAEILETTVQKEYIDQDEANDKLGKLNLASDITDKKIILIVEDNSDLRVLLSNIFIYDFTILEALNGQEGLEKARNVIPDVIISDIMMPVMDGLTFCEKCKEDDLISHVPIILLTAKADMDSRITGIKTGADAYINKPFNKKELLSQVENLISNRELLQKKYQKRLLIPHQKPGVENSKNTIKNFISPKNEEFIDKVKSIIEDNYHLETFNTDMLAKRILFTRQYLHRKFSGLTGLTPSQYIKEYRLNKARELLNSDKRLTVSEIVYKCGFKSISHFSRSYKEKFGKNPSE